MTARTFSSTLLLPCLLLLMGCEKTSVLEPPAATTAAYYVFGPAKLDVASMTLEDRVAFSDANEAHLQQARQIFQQTAHLARRHQEIQTLVTEHRGDDRLGFAQQEIALRMIESVLAQPDADDATRRILVPYVDLLLTHKNPDASVLLPALGRLEGIWPEARREAAIAHSTALAQAYLASLPKAQAEPPCEGCTASKNALRPPADMETVRQARLNAIEAALP